MYLLVARPWILYRGATAGCPLWIETKLFPSGACTKHDFAWKKNRARNSCWKFIYTEAFLSFLSFFFFFVPREKRISTLEKMKLFHAKNLFLAIAREFFPLSLSPSSFFKYSKRFTSGETFRRFLRKIIRERLVATLSERGKILEKEKKKKEEELFEFYLYYSKGIRIDFSGNIVLEHYRGEDDGITGAVSKIAPNIRREAIKLQLVRLTIQSLDCNDPAHCFGAVTINEKLPATDLLQFSPKYQRIPIHPRLSPSSSVPNRLRFHPCKQANPFRPVSP